jgi:predicted transcriptional regulator
MEGGAFSPLPEVGVDRVVGALSEGAPPRTQASAVAADPGAGGTRIRVPLRDEGFPTELLPGRFAHYLAVLVARRGDRKGIVTKANLIPGLHRTTLWRTAST